MSKYIDAEKLIAEIERRREKCADIAADERNEEVAEYYRGKEVAYDETSSLITSLQHEQPEADLEEYLSTKLFLLGADLIRHKPYSFNRGLNVGMTKAYDDILKKINAKKEE